MTETLRLVWQSAMAAIAGAPVGLLFAGLAVLPLVGVPTSPLWIAVGVRLGTWPGFIVALGALLVNYSAGYWLARYWLRGRVTRWIESRDWRVPEISAEDETLVILLLRITPGLPLFVQNYLLGLGQVNFGRYLVLSALIQAPQVLAFVWLGNSLAQNAVWRMLLAGGALVALTLLVVLVRRILRRRSVDPLSLSSNTSPSQS